MEKIIQKGAPQFLLSLSEW